MNFLPKRNPGLSYPRDHIVPPVLEPDLEQVLHPFDEKKAMSQKIIRKTLDEAQHVPNAEIDFSDKNLVHLDDMPRLWTMKNITRLTLSHNKVSELPAAIANMENMEILNLSNNSLQEVPQSISHMPKLR